MSEGKGKLEGPFTREVLRHNQQAVHGKIGNKQIRSPPSKSRQGTLDDSLDLSKPPVEDFIENCRQVFADMHASANNEEKGLSKKDVLHALANDKQTGDFYRRYGASFKLLDSDKSGTITFEEFTSFFLCKEYDITQHQLDEVRSVFKQLSGSKKIKGGVSLKKRAFIEALVKNEKIKTWMVEHNTFAYSFASMDLNDDSTVTWGEFLLWFSKQAAAHAMAEDKAEKQIYTSAKTIFNLCDKNGDKKLTLRELKGAISKSAHVQEFFKFPTPSAKRTKELFGKLDMNGDKTVTFQEFSIMVKEAINTVKNGKRKPSF